MTTEPGVDLFGGEPIDSIWPMELTSLSIVRLGQALLELAQVVLEQDLVCVVCDGLRVSLEFGLLRLRRGQFNLLTCVGRAETVLRVASAPLDRLAPLLAAWPPGATCFPSRRLAGLPAGLRIGRSLAVRPIPLVGFWVRDSSGLGVELGGGDGGCFQGRAYRPTSLMFLALSVAPPLELARRLLERLAADLSSSAGRPAPICVFAGNSLTVWLDEHHGRKVQNFTVKILRTRNFTAPASSQDDPSLRSLIRVHVAHQFMLDGFALGATQFAGETHLTSGCCWRACPG